MENKLEKFYEWHTKILVDIQNKVTNPWLAAICYILWLCIIPAILLVFLLILKLILPTWLIFLIVFAGLIAVVKDQMDREKEED